MLQNLCTKFVENEVRILRADAKPIITQLLAYRFLIVNFKTFISADQCKAGTTCDLLAIHQPWQSICSAMSKPSFAHIARSNHTILEVLNHYERSDPWKQSNQLMNGGDMIKKFSQKSIRDQLQMLSSHFVEPAFALQHNRFRNLGTLDHNLRALDLLVIFNQTLYIWSITEPFQRNNRVVCTINIYHPAPGPYKFSKQV
jgi:hypothetical protein